MELFAKILDHLVESDGEKTEVIQGIFEEAHAKLMADEEIKWEQIPEMQKTKALWGLCCLIYSFGEYEGLDMDGFDPFDEMEKEETAE